MTGGGPVGDDPGRKRLDVRRRRLRSGLYAERLAAVALMLRGYRIAARRLKTPYGELDIVAIRRGRLGRIAFVEVKRRNSIAEAQAALSPRQGQRIARAADYWLQRHPGDQAREVGLDAVLVVPWRWPHHIRNALDP
ncbi:MAG: YraN family protein [Hyphomicrobiaceae bacterium]